MKYTQTKTKPFRIKYEPVKFGWFMFYRFAENVKPEGGAWILHSVTYFLHFFILLVPAILLDISTSGILFILLKFIKLLKWIFDIPDDLTKKGTNKIIITFLKIIGRIVLILIITIVAISLYTNFQSWEIYLKKVFNFLEQLF